MGIIFSLGIILIPSSVFAYTVETNSGTTGISSIGSGEHILLGQEFNITTVGTVSSGTFCLYKTGGGSGTVTISVESGDVDSPSGVSLGSATISTDVLTGSGTYPTFTFSSPPSLSVENGTYWYFCCCY